MTTDQHAIVHEVADDERKAFVRACVHHAMARLGKNPMANTDDGRLLMVQEANFLWQKKQLRTFLRARGRWRYQDMKDFIHEHGWNAQWIPTRRLQAYWRSILRHGRL
jgi:hypothetical protein